MDSQNEHSDYTHDTWTNDQALQETNQMLREENKRN